MAFEPMLKQWLELCRDEPDLLEELQKAQKDPKALEDRFYRDLAFGTGGMRGVIGAGPNRMNIFTIRRAAAGLAEALKAEGGNKTVAISYDSRRYSARFARQTALVLAARGVTAYLFDSLRPVPLLSFAVRHLNTDAGVVITASHNPPEYNGFKAYGPDGAQLSPDKADSVTENIRGLAFEDCLPMDENEALQKGLLRLIGEDIDRAYNTMVLGLMACPELVKEVGPQLKLVYTPLHGSGNLPVRRALKSAGIEQVSVVPEQELPDPDFSTVKAPNPEDPAAFTLAIPLAQQLGASLILGTDPDCDRLGACVKDKDGVFRTLSGNQIGCLLLHHLLSQNQAQGRLAQNSAAVMSIVSTQLAKAICDDFGVTLFEVLTGFKFVGEKIQEFEEDGSHTFVFGFEESFGYLSGTAVRDKDAVNAALILAEAACACLKEGITLYERLQRIYARYGFFQELTWSGTYPGKEGADKIKAIMEKLHRETPSSIGGLKVLEKRDYLAGEALTAEGETRKLGFPPSDVLYFKLDKQAWACARPSGTEPKIKFYAGARHPGGASEALKATEDLLAAFKQLAE